MRGLLLSTLLLASGAAGQEPPVGLWHARLVAVASHPVSFAVRVARKGDGLAAVLINGASEEPFSSATWDGETLTLLLAHYDAKISATRKGDSLAGTYTRVGAAGPIQVPFDASRTAPPAPRPKKPGASVEGTWAVELAEPKGVVKGTGLFRQRGTTVTGTVTTAAGDYGPLHGTFDGEDLVLTVFNGFFIYRFDAELLPDGTLAGEFRQRISPPADWKARRLSDKTAADAASGFGTVQPKNPGTPFVFSFPDADGKEVSSEDPRFKGRPMIVTFMGTWCPNCHDEAAVLRDLQARYRARGLEVVALTWEYTDDVERSRRLVSQFVARNGVNYPILFAGTTKGAATSGPRAQLDGFAGYPTTLYLDRSHRIVRVHSGFDGPATGERHALLKREIDATAKKLLGTGTPEVPVPGTAPPGPRGAPTPPRAGSSAPLS